MYFYFYRDTADLFKSEFADPGSWPEEINEKTRSLIVHGGPVQIQNFDFPKNSSGRKFTTNNYYSKLKNGNLVLRDWLVYSKLKNSVFCFPCKLFGTWNIQLTNKFGNNDWRNLSKVLKEHESSLDHKNNVLAWKDFKLLSNKGQTIQSMSTKAISSEVCLYKIKFVVRGEFLTFLHLYVFTILQFET